VLALPVAFAEVACELPACELPARLCLAGDEALAFFEGGGGGA
jgi:hypothetical protein